MLADFSFGRSIQDALPGELATALGARTALRAAFDGLTERQRTCYTEWVGSAAPGDRASRAALVASVVRVLADLPGGELGGVSA